MIAGGFTAGKPKDDAVMAIMTEVQNAPELKNLGDVEVESYQTQVVAGTNYIINLKHSGGTSVLKVFKALPHTGKAAEVKSITTTPAAVESADADGASTTVTSTDKPAKSGWLPLESAPEVLNPFLKGMGVDANWGFTDIYGTDPALLAMVPQPCAAVCLLFPCTPKLKAFKKDQHTKILSKGQKLPKNLRYITQLDAFGNACGTIAAIHAVANSNVPIGKGLLASFITETDGLDPRKRGEALLNHSAIRKLSDSCARSEEASTRCPEAEEKVGAHFISFVHVNGELFEMDGRKAFPIHHGPTTPETLLTDAVKAIVANFMKVETENPRFSMMALAKLI